MNPEGKLLSTPRRARKRRTIEPEKKTHLLRVSVNAATRERLDELSDRYGVAPRRRWWCP